MSPPTQLAKRALVTLLLALGCRYDTTSALNRDSPDSLVLDAFKRAARKAHPDKGGCTEDQQKLKEAREKWEQTRREKSAKAAGEGRASGGGLVDCTTGQT